MTWSILEGDCRAVMAGMPEASVDAIVCDPPYGLEFMGKEWDQFRSDDPGTARHRGDRAGIHGELVTDGDGAHPARGTIGVAYGGGKRPKTYRCVGCGKRDQFRNDHDCVGAVSWKAETLDPFAAPPTMLAFENWSRVWALAALRVLKPGGHLLAFGGTRTFHRLTCALEDAGFEIRDCLSWLYGSGFPKSLDVSKAIDKAAGAEREVVGVKAGHEDFAARTDAHAAGGRSDGWDRPWRDDAEAVARSHMATAPATAAARQWDGWGTALKPAWEPIVLARKPLGERNVAANVQRYGTGGLNVDGCRLDFASDADEAESKGKNQHQGYMNPGSNRDSYSGHMPPRQNYDAAGRWPPNVAMDAEAAAMLDAQTGPQVSGGTPPTRPSFGGLTTGLFAGQDAPNGIGRTAGDVSRFFYCPKADRAERNVGLDGGMLWGGDEVAESPLLWSSGEQSPGTFQAEGTHRAARNHHPTVKPVALMRWLCRLVTPPGGLVLDPFVGSGSTGIAALAEGFSFIGIEREAEYVAIARARIGAGAAAETAP